MLLLSRVVASTLEYYLMMANYHQPISHLDEKNGVCCVFQYRVINTARTQKANEASYDSKGNVIVSLLH
jgi:hypothetical protein